MDAESWQVIGCDPSGPSVFVFLAGTRPVSLRRLNALKPTELPALLQTRPDARQLLPERAGQPTQKSLHLRGADLKRQEPIQTNHRGS